MIILRNCEIQSCGGGIRTDGIVDGLDIDGLTVTDTPSVLQVNGMLRNARVRNVIHHPILHQKIGRNEPCWCGSEKKFKKCHGG